MPKRIDKVLTNKGGWNVEEINDEKEKKNFCPYIFFHSHFSFSHQKRHLPSVVNV